MSRLIPPFWIVEAVELAHYAFPRGEWDRNDAAKEIYGISCVIQDLARQMGQARQWDALVFALVDLSERVNARSGVRGIEDSISRVMVNDGRSPMTEFWFDSFPPDFGWVRESTTTFGIPFDVDEPKMIKAWGKPHRFQPKGNGWFFVGPGGFYRVSFPVGTTVTGIPIIKLETKTPMSDHERNQEFFRWLGETTEAAQR